MSSWPERTAALTRWRSVACASVRRPRRIGRNVAELDQKLIGGVAGGLDRIVGVRFDTRCVARRGRRAECSSHRRERCARLHDQRARKSFAVRAEASTIVRVGQSNDRFARHRRDAAATKLRRDQIHQAEANPDRVRRRIERDRQHDRRQPFLVGPRDGCVRGRMNMNEQHAHTPMSATSAIATRGGRTSRLVSGQVRSGYRASMPPMVVAGARLSIRIVSSATSMIQR